MSKTFDLSSLGLEPGTYAVTVKATGKNVYDSEASAEVSYSVSSTKLINFSVQGIYNCQAEEGMTWGEWVDSEYNTSSFLIQNGEVHTSGFAVVRLNGAVVKGTDTIIADATYTRDEMTSG